MNIKEIIEQKLHNAFNPSMLEVADDSEQHRGHAGFQEGGETHFTVKMVSDVFVSKSRIERHRMVFSVLEEELEGRVHALALKLHTKKESENYAQSDD